MFFSVKALILAGILTLFCIVLINAPFGELNSYARSYDARIGLYTEKLEELSRISSWKQRMLLRHVANASIPFWIAEHRRSTDTILLPPKEYADKYIKADAVWTDPRIFTYMAGFQPIVAWADTVRRHKANTFIALEPAAITLVREGGQIDIDSLLREYNQAIAEARVSAKAIK